jgi:hypothetical protein
MEYYLAKKRIGKLITVKNKCAISILYTYWNQKVKGIHIRAYK